MPNVRIDILGQKFGDLVVVEPAKVPYWTCRCWCGKTIKARIDRLRSGYTKHCGCQFKAHNKGNFIDRTGIRYGRLTAMERTSHVHDEAGWICRCDCGTTVIVRGSHLSGGQTKSCGCLVREKSKEIAGFNFAARWWLNKMNPGMSSARYVYRSYKRSALTKALRFEMTFDDFMQMAESDCFYCGAKPSRVKDMRKKRMNGTFTYNGIDRVRNSLGYVPGNMVACCTRCNYAKSASDDFLEWVARVYARHFTGKERAA